MGDNRRKLEDRAVCYNNIRQYQVYNNLRNRVRAFLEEHGRNIHSVSSCQFATEVHTTYQLIKGGTAVFIERESCDSNSYEASLEVKFAVEDRELVKRLQMLEYDKSTYTMTVAPTTFKASNLPLDVCTTLLTRIESLLPGTIRQTVCEEGQHLFDTYKRNDSLCAIIVYDQNDTHMNLELTLEAPTPEKTWKKAEQLFVEYDFTPCDTLSQKSL
jgi:hypothetical protein